MPKCAKCYSLIPPDLSILQKDGDHICVFCDRDVDGIKVNTRGYEELYTRKQCEQDYKELLRKLKDSPKVTEIMAKGIKM